VKFLSLEPLLGPLPNLNLAASTGSSSAESRAGSAPMDREWVLDIRDQCQSARAPFFFKQWAASRRADRT